MASDQEFDTIEWPRQHLSTFLCVHGFRFRVFAVAPRNLAYLSASD